MAFIIMKYIDMVVLAAIHSRILSYEYISYTFLAFTYMLYHRFLHTLSFAAPCWHIRYHIYTTLDTGYLYAMPCAICFYQGHARKYYYSNASLLCKLCFLISTLLPT